MRIFRTRSEIPEGKMIRDIESHIEFVEKILGEIRQIIGNRRTILKNADKKLQEFQDSMYAMIMEEEYLKQKIYRIEEIDDEDPSS